MKKISRKVNKNLLPPIKRMRVGSMKKNKKKETEKSDLDEKSSKKTSNISVAGLALAGSSVFLIRRIMLMALASSLNPAVGPTLGLIGIVIFLAVQVLTIHSYSKTLKDPKVEGRF